MVDTKIRQLKPSDSEEDMLDLFEQLKEERPEQCYVVNIAHQEKCFSFVAATEQDKILAFGALSLQFKPDKGRDVGHVESYVVHEDFRGEGIGTRLLERIKREAIRIGLKEVYLTSREERVEARKIYEKFGFKPVETDLFLLEILQ